MREALRFLRDALRLALRDALRLALRDALREALRRPPTFGGATALAGMFAPAIAVTPAFFTNSAKNPPNMFLREFLRDCLRCLRVAILYIGQRK